MTVAETVIAGVSKADGTLELNEKPNLSPGPVTVVLRQAAKVATPQSVGDEFFRTMEEIWAGQKARGHIPRSAADSEVSRREMRDQMEEEVEAAVRLQEESRRRREQADSETTKP
jgi:hypothetical protein